MDQSGFHVKSTGKIELKNKSVFSISMRTETNDEEGFSCNSFTGLGSFSINGFEL